MRYTGIYEPVYDRLHEANKALRLALRPLERDPGGSDLAREYSEKLSRLADDIYDRACRLGVAGQMSAGKSSLVNGLLHKEVAATKLERCTVNVTVLRSSGDTDGQARVKYMSMGEFRLLIRTFLDKLGWEIPPSWRADATDTPALDSPTSELLERAKQVLEEGGSKRPELVKELVEILEAFRTHGSQCLGTTLAVDPSPQVFGELMRGWAESGLYLLQQAYILPVSLDLLQPGIEIVDMPGLGASYLRDQIVSLSYLSRVHALLLVTSCRSLFAKEAANVLGEMRSFRDELTDKVTVALTQVDLLNPKEVEELESTWGVVGSSLRRLGISSAPTFFTSAYAYQQHWLEGAQSKGAVDQLRVLAETDGLPTELEEKLADCRDGDGMAHLRRALASRLDPDQFHRLKLRGLHESLRLGFRRIRDGVAGCRERHAPSMQLEERARMKAAIKRTAAFWQTRDNFLRVLQDEILPRLHDDDKREGFTRELIQDILPAAREAVKNACAKEALEGARAEVTRRFPGLSGAPLRNQIAQRTIDRLCSKFGNLVADVIGKTIEGTVFEATLQVGAGEIAKALGPDSDVSQLIRATIEQARVNVGHWLRLRSMEDLWLVAIDKVVGSVDVAHGHELEGSFPGQLQEALRIAVEKNVQRLRLVLWRYVHKVLFDVHQAIDQITSKAEEDRIVELILNQPFTEDEEAPELRLARDLDAADDALKRAEDELVEADRQLAADT